MMLSGRGRTAAAWGDSYVFSSSVGDPATVDGGRDWKVDTAEGEASVDLAWRDFHLGTLSPVEGRLHPGMCLSCFFRFNPFPTWTHLRVRPANYQSGWKLHGSDLRENRTVGSPWLVFHENGPYLVIWAFKKPKKWPKNPKFRIF